MQMKFTEILSIFQQQKGDNHIVTSRQMKQRQIVVLICTKQKRNFRQDLAQAASHTGLQHPQKKEGEVCSESGHMAIQNANKGACCAE